MRQWTCCFSEWHLIDIVAPSKEGGHHSTDLTPTVKCVLLFPDSRAVCEYSGRCTDQMDFQQCFELSANLLNTLLTLCIKTTRLDIKHKRLHHLTHMLDLGAMLTII